MEHRPSTTEEPFAKAFRANPAPMVVSDKTTGEIFHVNERWIKLVGYSREEMIHHTSKELNFGVDWKARTAILRLYESRGEVPDVPAQPFDLVLTDVVMPGMNDRQFVEHVLAKHPTTTVLCMPGYSDDIIVHHGLVNGSVDVLATKPREVLSPQPAPDR